MIFVLLSLLLWFKILPFAFGRYLLCFVVYRAAVSNFIFPPSCLHPLPPCLQFSLQAAGKNILSLDLECWPLKCTLENNSSNNGKNNSVPSCLSISRLLRAFCNLEQIILSLRCSAVERINGPVAELPLNFYPSTCCTSNVAAKWMIAHQRMNEILELRLTFCGRGHDGFLYFQF